MRISDWSSDVCSSDLVQHRMGGHERAAPIGIPRHGGRVDAAARPAAHATEHGAPVVPLLPAAFRRAALGCAHARAVSPLPMAGSPPSLLLPRLLAAPAAPPSVLVYPPPPAAVLSLLFSFFLFSFLFFFFFLLFFFLIFF